MRILVGMSGGLDSTYAALALKEQGHEVEGAVALMHEYTETDDARRAAESIGIPLHIIDARERFENIVIADFISEYSRARTPNPCVICNSEVKFRVLLDYALEHGFDKIATGHYAEIVETDHGYAVRRCADAKKDQTYMLWRLPQDVLSHLVFPLSSMSKEDIRVDARTRGLFVADKRDSQEICFIPSGDHASYIAEQGIIAPHGNFVDKNGKILGEHEGITRYTVGQRKGLGISLGARAFITRIDADTNCITVDTEPASDTRVELTSLVFSGISRGALSSNQRFTVKLRYQAKPVSCTVIMQENDVELLLDEPSFSVTPGQSAVVYDGDVIAFGGLIK